jgi:hypothetical protein
MKLRWGDRYHTWYNHSLGSHYEDDLHWAKLCHSNPSALNDGMAQFEGEDSAVAPYGNSLENVHDGNDTALGAEIATLHCADIADNGDCESVPNGDESED